jgi:hypothetical protein
MRWILISLVLLGTLRLHAANPDVWHLGDVASEDIRTPVALDVTDPNATPMSKAEAASKTPAIFIAHPNVTNTMVENLTTAFTSTHTDFLAGLKETFQQSNLSDATIQSPEFENFVRGFNVKGEKLSISPGLARQWARGETGLDTFSNLVTQLLQATDRPVLPDTLPDGFVLSDTVRLVPYHSSQEELTLTLEQAEQTGTIFSRSSLTTVTQLRALFRRNFSAEDKLLAHSLATFIHSNVKLDTNLTEIARDRAARSTMPTDHYEAGQIIVRRGQVVDAKILAALTRLNDVSPPAQPSPPAPVVREPAQPAPMPTEKSQPAPALPGQAQDIRGNYIWMGAACTGVSVLILLAYWRLQVTGRRQALIRQRTTEPFSPNQMRLPPELAPQLAEMLKSVVVQELASQRRELLQTQQYAAVEVVRLMQRLNELRAPLEERLAAYEQHILELEKELGEQSKENRELLKLQIDMLKEQVKTERAASRINFN